MDVRHQLPAHSRGKKLFSSIFVMQCISTSSRCHLQHRFLMPPTRRAWPKKFGLTKGGFEIRIADCGIRILVYSPKAQIENPQNKYLDDCVCYCAPNSIATATGFCGISHYAVIFERACNPLQVLS